MRHFWLAAVACRRIEGSCRICGDVILARGHRNPTGDSGKWNIYFFAFDEARKAVLHQVALSDIIRSEEKKKKKKKELLKSMSHHLPMCIHCLGHNDFKTRFEIADIEVVVPRYCAFTPLPNSYNITRSHGAGARTISAPRTML